ncbi:TUBE1 (predicted) [Pycnogonum litorale]
MTQSLIIQVGQCGNQIGGRFWDLALREHASVNKNGVYDDALRSFFRNVDLNTKTDLSSNLGARISSLKARAILVDMEEGVVSELLRGPIRDLFDSSQLVTDVSGSGNNWCVGYHQYGRMYRTKLLDLIRAQVEKCDCLQCFFMIHSMGGGTGAGLGTAILRLLEDEFPSINRFVMPVYPSSNDDVITSPYNTILAMKQLTDSADCVIPLENQALFDICDKIQKTDRTKLKVRTELTSSAGSCTKGRHSRPFDEMNNIAANLILHITSSSRFGGSLNTDLNDITTNLVPYPRMHYVTSSLSPLYSSSDIHISYSRSNGLFNDLISRDHTMIKTKSTADSVYLACAVLARGNFIVSDININIQRLQTKMKFVPWNEYGWKTGICKVGPFGHPRSLLLLANNTSIHNNFAFIRNRFVQLFNKKAHLHHYLQVDGMDSSLFDESLNSSNQLIDDYVNIEKRAKQQCNFPRLEVL